MSATVAEVDILDRRFSGNWHATWNCLCKNSECLGYCLFSWYRFFCL